MSEYGSGPFLDENFDLTVDSVGDVKISNDGDELEKDLGFQLTFSLRRFLGASPTQNAEAKAKSTAIDVVEADPRVDRVVKREIEAELSDDTRTLTVRIPLITTDGVEFTFVYDI
jgi:hypothetical protein